jgi:DNA-binding MarR family transcriptional regulator
MREILLKNELWDIIRTITANMDSVFNPIVKCYGLTMIQSRILIGIDKCSNTNIGNISEMLDISSPNVSNMCKRLEKHGFIIRNRSQEDERIVTLELTEKGMETLKNINKDLNQKFKPILDSKSDKDFEDIITGMRKLNELLRELS